MASSVVGALLPSNVIRWLIGSIILVTAWHVAEFSTLSIHELGRLVLVVAAYKHIHYIVDPQN